jgi:hypothetical protein
MATPDSSQSTVEDHARAAECMSEQVLYLWKI